MKKNNPTLQTEQSTKTDQLLSEITELLSVKHVTSLVTSRNYVKPIGESEFSPSKTQPNDVLSIREILDKYTRGLPVSAGDVGYYDDPEDIDLSDFDAMDPFEKEMYIRENREYLQELERRHAEEQKEQQKDTEAQLPVNSSAPQEQESARSETGRKSAPDTSEPAPPAR